MTMRFKNRFEFITKECQIPATQIYTLSTTPFAREHEFASSSAAVVAAADPAAVVAAADPAADGGVDSAVDGSTEEAWPVSSDDDGGSPVPDDDPIRMIFCSLPSEDEDVVGDVAGKRGREESEGSPPLTAAKKLRFSDVGCGSLDGVRSRNGNDVVSESIEELESRLFGRGVVVEKSKKLEIGVNGGGNTKEAKNDVVKGNSEELGFHSQKTPTNDVVSENSSDLGFERTRKRTEEKLRFCESCSGKMRTNDVVSGNSSDLGFHGERTTRNSSFSNGAENAKSVADDVVSQDSIELGFERMRKRTEAKFPMPSPPIITKQLRFSGGDDEAEATVAKIGEDSRFSNGGKVTKSVEDDVVSRNSVDFDQKSTKQSRFSGGDGAQVTTEREIALKIGDNGAKENSVGFDQKLKNQLKFPGGHGTETAEVAVERDTAIVDTDEEHELNTEEVIKDDTVEVHTTDSSDDDDNDNDKSDSHAEEEVGKGKSSTLEASLKTENRGGAMKCLMKVLRTLAERKKKEMEKAKAKAKAKAKDGGGDGDEDEDEDEDEEVDFFKTAVRRGYTFPKPRWMS